MPITFATFDFEQALWNAGKRLVCGVDEVGRGCFAGPVVTAAVVFDPEKPLMSGLADSKLLTAKARTELAKEIKEKALFYSITSVEVPIINDEGIGNATQRCFKKSIEALQQSPEFILIDAFYIQDVDKSIQKPIKKGDMLCSSIAAASIIAKVFRDAVMEQFDQQFPEYKFAENKGYGTKAHRQAISQYGLCDLHRTSFNLGQFLRN